MSLVKGGGLPVKIKNVTHCLYFSAVVGVFILVMMVFLLRPVQGDEGYSFVKYVSSGLRDTVSLYTPNNHILYNVMANLCCRLLGGALWAQRLPSFIAGLGIIFINYDTVRLLFRSRRAAFLSTVFLFSVPVFLGYCALARGYALLVLLVLSGFYCLVRIVRGGGLHFWWGYVLLSALAAYDLIIAFYAIFAGLIWYVMVLPRGNRGIGARCSFKALAVIVLMVFLFYFPVIKRMGLAAMLSSPLVKPQSFSELSFGLLVFPWHLFRQWFEGALVLAIIVVPGFLGGIFLPSRNWYSNIVLITAVTVSLLVVTLLIMKLPYERCLIFGLPFFLMICSGCIAKLIVHKGFYFFTFCLFVLFQVQALNSPTARQADLKSGPQVMAEIAAIARSGDLVIANTPADAVLPYYFYINRITLDYFRTDAAHAQRIFIVSKKGLDGRDADFFGPFKGLAANAKVFYFDDAMLYVFGKS